MKVLRIDNSVSGCVQSSENSKIIWIAWEKHRRTRELCSFLNIQAFLLISSLPRIIKHPLLMLKTWYIIHKTSPKVLIVQNPSIILTTLSCILRKIYCFRLVVDSHNAGIIPANKILEKLNLLYRYLQKVPDLTIVTNQELSKLVLSNGGKPFVLPDKIPFPTSKRKLDLSGEYNVVVISTFDSDEPYEVVFEASKHLEGEVKFYVTGNYKKLPKKLIESVSNLIQFTGYLADKDYWDLLFSANTIIDLTNLDNCLVCGAYEAVAVGTPLILSNTQVTKAYFHKGAIYTSQDVNNIVKAIREALEKENELRKEIRELRVELEAKWLEVGRNFKDTILKWCE